MKKHIYVILTITLVSFLTGCGGMTTQGRDDPMGLSGKRSKDAELAFAKARILWNKQDVCSDPETALSLLNQAISADASYAEAYLRRGLAKSDLRDWDGAFDDLSKAIRLDPTAEAYAFRGLVSLRGGNYLGARKDLDRSLSLTSRQHRAWNFRGSLNLLEGKRAEACDDYENGCDYGDCHGLESARETGECPR